MNKREKTEILPKEKKTKRIKTTHARPNVLAFIQVNVDCFRLEEQESIEDCYELFMDTCLKLRTHFSVISKMKVGKENEVSEMQDRTHVCMLVMRLKKLNRLDKHQWKKSKDIVSERKQNVDAMNLQYQNLLYEATHLQKEVTKCMEFRSEDEEIVLVSEEEFYRDAPEDISKPTITKKDPHELAMARLFWELEQRKRIGIDLKEADVTRNILEQEIKQLEENVAGIQPVLEAIIQVAEPFTSKMGMQFQAIPLSYNVARYLPRPLYILYVHACAYQEHISSQCKEDMKFQVRIGGSLDEAKALIGKSDDEMSDDSGDSDQEESTELNVHRRSVSEKKEPAEIDIMAKHPMSVLISIDRDLRIDLEFRYLTHLQIVSVAVQSLTPEPMAVIYVGDLLRQDTFLNCLYSGDTGKETPNLANIHLLNENCSVSDSPFTNETTGWPYVWAQKISGLDFLSPPAEGNRRMYTDIPISLKKTMNAISTRLAFRSQLYKQISSLEQRLSVPPSFAALYPVKIPSELKKWNPVSWKEVQNYANIEELQNLRIVGEDCLSYHAEIQRVSAHLSAFVCIPPNYPEQTPVFLLQLNWKGSHTTLTSFALRDLEEEINVHFVESLPGEFCNQLLLCQLYHLLVCLDVFLEVESSRDPIVGPHEFTREKVVVRYARGLGRSRPYKCVSTQGIFTYR